MMKNLWNAVALALLVAAASCGDRQEVAVNPPDSGGQAVNPEPRPMNPPASTMATGAPVGVGEPAPDFTVTSLDGRAVRLSSLKGKPVLIDFWATWCPPCRESLPHTNEIAAKHGDKLHVVAISDESKPVIEKFMKDNKYTFPAFRDEKQDALRLYKVDGIPTFVVVDAEGRLVFYQSGYGGPGTIDAALAKVGITA